MSFVLRFLAGFILGQAYYVCWIKNIPISYNIKIITSSFLCILLGFGTAVSIQLRCISLLTLIIYCGKPGRGVLKAVVLSFVVAGPITNMGLNAKEVVRVFGCSSELSYNISKGKYFKVHDPIRETIRSLKSETYQVIETLKYFRNIVLLLEREVEQPDDTQQFTEYNDYMYDTHQPLQINQSNSTYIKSYLSKLKQRCERHLYYSEATCTKAFSSAYVNCCNVMPNSAAWMLCWPVKLPQACTSFYSISKHDTCNYMNEIDPGFEEAYTALKRIKMELTDRTEVINLRSDINNKDDLCDIQNAKETSALINHAFEEKISIMRFAVTIMDICLALLFLRILHAAVVYHDKYLSSIDYDNVYIMSYFKRLDRRRKNKNKVTLLPLKKMERYKYVDVYSFTYTADRSKLFAQILKVILEMVTATTFVMLDRLFYEALDVVRQHAEIESKQGMQGLDIEVEGTGILASFMVKLLHNLLNRGTEQCVFSNEECIPRPRLMPSIFFVKIYGGYVFILVLLYINPYTFRLRSLLCGYFYPRRQNQRILHLYNDILKKRMKLQKTLHRKAVQAARAYYLSGESILSLRMRFPQLLGWLRVWPAARMSCLICGETEPGKDKPFEDNWHLCSATNCPFIYCAECWIEIGQRCLACDPNLADLSDIDSLSDDEPSRN